MKYKVLKNTDLNLSCIVMGADGFGATVGQERAYALLNHYSDAGGNVLDTAECYSQWIPGGVHASENLLGKWMQEKKNRHNLILSTKGGFYRPGEIPRLSRNDIFHDLEGSLARLETDYIDLYWLHRDAPALPVDEMMDTLALAVKQGKVRYIGVSNWAWNRVDQANRYARDQKIPLLIGSQIQYSPARPNIEQNEPDLVLMNQEEYDYYKSHELSVFGYAAQAKGFFSQYAQGGEAALSVKAKSRYYNEDTLRVYKNLKELSEVYGCSIGGMVVAALIQNRDFDTFPIIGCKTIEQLKDSLSGGDIDLTEQAWRSIY